MKLDVGVVNQTLGSLKAAADVAESAKVMDDIARVKGKVVEMLDLILSAHGAAVQTQAQLLEMLQENHELKSQLNKVQQWDGIASRYRLKDFGDGTFAYELDPALTDQEPSHLLCSNCFQVQRKSILQYSHTTHTQQRLYRCNGCSNDVVLGNRVRVQPSRPNSSGLF